MNASTNTSSSESLMNLYIGVLMIVVFLIVNLLAINCDFRNFVSSLTTNSSFISTLAMNSKLVRLISLLTATGAAFFLLRQMKSNAEKRNFFLTSAVGGWTITAAWCVISIFANA